MTVEGTVVNGRIVLDGSPELPDGARVRVEWTEDWTDRPGPPFRETHAEIVESLRQSIAAMKAGERGVPLGQAMAQIAEELNLPPVEPE